MGLTLHNPAVRRGLDNRDELFTKTTKNFVCTRNILLPSYDS